MLRAHRLVLVATSWAALSLFGCSEGGSGSGAATTTQAAAAPPPTTAAPQASAPAPTATATAVVPRADCPKGSSGEGSLKAPCEAKGKDRMMEVTWNGKMGDDGPSFRIVNKSTLTILYGKVVAYFYDKAGKQLELKDESGKTRPNQVCFGNLFSGVMKPGEKAVVTFSCVKKSHVPDGTAAIEAELQIAGFADATEKKSEFYWKNAELTPDARPKGGVK